MLLLSDVYGSEPDLKEILQRLRSKINESGLRNAVNVDRSDILDGAFRAFNRKSFNMSHKLKVDFAGEDSQDNGGPTREFLRLSIGAIRDLSIFAGPDTRKILNLDYKGIRCI